MENLIFILEQIHRMTQIPVYYMSGKTTVVLLNLGYSTDETPFIADEPYIPI